MIDMTVKKKLSLLVRPICTKYTNTVVYQNIDVRHLVYWEVYNTDDLDSRKV